tara:strand:- start:405 stop:650 length:246 start_codon:yes stop_codon:yes gene_type:complete
MNISSKQEDIDIDNLIGVVVRQTTCSTEEAEKMLQQKQFDVMSTIKSLLNINEKKKDKKIESINQEIYRQIRTEIEIRKDL